MEPTRTLDRLLQHLVKIEDDLSNLRMLSSLLFEEAVQKQAAEAALRRDEVNLRKVFNSYNPVQDIKTCQDKISKESLKQALNDLTPTLTNDDFEALFTEFDADSDGLIDFDEFKKAVWRPSAIEKWAKSLHFWKLVADAVPLSNKSDQLRAMADLSEDQLMVIFTEATKSMQQTFLAEVKKLQLAYQAMDAKKQASSQDGAAAKFKTFKASAGSVTDFHNGLMGRVGALAI